MLVVTVELDGLTHQVDLETIDAKEFRRIKAALGLKAGAFIRSFSDPDDLDIDAIVAVLWLAEKRAGNPAAAFRDDLPWLEVLAAVKAVEGEPADEADGAPKGP